MEASITLWKCVPLRARITQRQCALNRVRAAQDAGIVALAALSEPGQGPIQCVGCPGLEWWAEKTGELPRRVATPELVREHVSKDAQRRLLGGLPPSAPSRDAERRRRRARATA